MTPHARSERLVVEEVGGELLVYDLERDQAHCLNAETSFVWRNADGNRSVSQLVEIAGQHFRNDIDEATVLSALESLSDAHLLAHPVSRAADADRQSRRQMIKRVSLAGGIAAAAAITSIAAPTPADAQSLPPDPGPD